MTVDELYKHSKKAYAGHLPLTPKEILSTRTKHALQRAGYARLNKETNELTLDYEKIQFDVLNGNIWYAKNIGSTSVREICEWILDREQHG